jgi:MinD-like ATPase involved in chromosome partitioning or flagellar assembly
MSMNEQSRGRGGQRGRPLRLAVGIGDPERERDILPELDATADMVVAERCLSADTLLEAVLARRVDAVLVSYDLHRLGRSLPELEASGIPRVLLVHDPEEPRWQPLGGIVLPVSVAPDVVVEAVQAAVRGEPFGRTEAEVEPVAFEFIRPKPDDAPPVESVADTRAEDDRPVVFAIASGHGAPGRTMVAVNLAAALGAVAPTVLIDGDLAGPSIAAYIDADPTRNVYMVAHAEPSSAWEWHNALEQECQLLDRRSPRARVLCGIPKPEMRARLGRSFLEGLLAALRHEVRYVVIDTGAELLGTDGAFHRAVLGLADQVLLVAGGDLIGVWHARNTLKLIREQLQIDAMRTALIVNRHDPRFHHTRAEIEWALGIGTAAIVPFDHVAVQRAVASQRPVVVDQKSRAGHALLDLAGRIHGGKLVLPPEPGTPVRRGFRGVVDRVSGSLRLPSLTGAGPVPAEESDANVS